jgi:hypothetical protein
LGFQTLEADSAKLGLQRKLYILGVKESLKPPAIEENRQAFDCQLSAQREEFFTFCLLGQDLLAITRFQERRGNL